MTESTELVVVHKRQGSSYNDFLGKYYHFPKKYLPRFEDLPKRFVYFEPPKDGKGTYFGIGSFVKVFPDKREDGQYFAEISGYQTFGEEVPFSNGGAQLEGPPYFNAQNAVRQISSSVFKEICLLGGRKLSFVPDAHLIRVLGEELIASEEIGILELIKNAFDANASNCKILIEQVPCLDSSESNELEFPELDGPVVVVEDDGCGMDLETIENGWMRPASVLKTIVKAKIKREREKAMERGAIGAYDALISGLKKQYNGRIPLGEKGVGRFAAHRLGRKLVLKTKKADNDQELVLEIDWEKFDRSSSSGPVDLSSILIDVKSGKPSRDYGDSGSGTILIMYGGREGFELTKKRIIEIGRSVVSLKSPSHAPSKFNIEFDCPQLADEFSRDLTDDFPPAFSIDALVSENGTAELEWIFNPPKAVPLPKEENTEIVDLIKFDSRYWGESSVKRAPVCGPFFLHIDVWYRSAPWMSGPDKKLFTEYLDNYGGISIFRDGMSILPANFGSKVDWLKLSKRHIKKHINLSYYTIIGNLEIEQGNNINLTDKTDRQGLLENIAFQDLSQLTRQIVLYMENHYKNRRTKFQDLTVGLIRNPRKLKAKTAAASDLVDRIVNRYDIVKDSSEILSSFGPPEERADNLINLGASLRSLKQSVDSMEEVLDQLTEQAGYGLSMGVAVHEIAKITSNFYSGLTKYLKSSNTNDEELHALKDSAQSLKQEVKRLGPFRAVRNEKATTFSVQKNIKFVVSVFKRQLEKRGIDISVSGKPFDVFARYGALNQVLSNLLDNASYWLSVSELDVKKILIEIDSDNRFVIVADSGEGVADGIRPYLFEPGYSLKHPPSGLGLYICKYYLKSFGGDIYECPKNHRIPEFQGAQFLLDFSHVLADKE